MFTVYSKPNCPNCNYSKKLLKDNNIKYEEINGEKFVIMTY